MNVGDLGPDALARRLRGPGLALRTGPFVARLVTSLPEIAAALARLYVDFPLDDDGIADFHLRMRPTSPLRRWWRPKVEVLVDGEPPFLPAPRRMAFPLFEWGLNWCVYNRAHQYLVFHAGVVARDGCAIVFPGLPGTGKSTLCAGLLGHGWRLLSDEFALVRPEGGDLAGLARPISLKDGAIDVIRAFAPEAEIGPTCAATPKGRVAHMRPPPASVRRIDEPARARWIVFPRYRPGAAGELVPLAKARAFFRIADSSFNYHVLGVRGFEAVGRLIEACACYDFAYGSLDDAAALFDALAADEPPARRGVR